LGVIQIFEATTLELVSDQIRTADDPNGNAIHRPIEEVFNVV